MGASLHRVLRGTRRLAPTRGCQVDGDFHPKSWLAFSTPPRLRTSKAQPAISLEGYGGLSDPTNRSRSQRVARRHSVADKGRQQSAPGVRCARCDVQHPRMWLAAPDARAPFRYVTEEPKAPKRPLRLRIRRLHGRPRMSRFRSRRGQPEEPAPTRSEL